MKVALAISGASGIMLGLKTLKALARHGCEVHLVISKDACHTAVYELGKPFSRPQHFIETLSTEDQKQVIYHSCSDFSSPIASGSFRVDASLIVPCSMASLGAIAAGISDNLIRRMADVALKEQRRLVIVPREAPFSAIHLENMLKLSKLGVCIMPPIPTWYVPITTLDEIEDAIVGKILQLIGIDDESLLRPWKGQHQSRIE